MIFHLDLLSVLEFITSNKFNICFNISYPTNFISLLLPSVVIFFLDSSEKVMIQYGEDKYKSDLKEIWRLCFPSDPEAFIHFYFDKVYKNEETLLYVENGCPVAALQMIPYIIKTGINTPLAGYISGAMTHPDFRKKGYMDQLLKDAFAKMKENGYDYIFLIPQEKWLLGFYARYGYTTLNNVDSVSNRFFLQSSGNGTNAFTCFDDVDVNRLYQLYSFFLQQNENVVLKAAPQFTNILWNFFDEKGVLFVNDLGIAFTFKNKNQIIIKELFHSGDETKEEFLHAIRQYYGLSEIIFPDRPKGMIKRINDSAPEITDIYMSMMLD